MSEGPVSGNIMALLLKQNRVVDLLALARYTYAVGEPILTDSQYEKVQKFCIDSGLAKEYMERTYDDDPIPIELLKEFGIELEVPEVDEDRKELYAYLSEERSMSIEAVGDYEKAWDFVTSYPGKTFVMSVKVDGVYTKKLWLNDVFSLGLSRGRTGDPWDCTKALSYIIPTMLNTGTSELKVYSECFVVPTALDYLKEKYDPSKFKTEKSSAISMIRKEKDKDREDYQFVRTLTFNADGLGESTVSGTLAKAKELGFDVVPHLVIEPEDVPKDKEDFVEWLRGKLDKLWQMGFGIPSDGVVMEVDDKNVEAKITNQYSARNIALKMEHWSFSYYPGIVTEILDNPEETQRRVKCSCKVKIEPVLARDNTKASVINCFNPGILIKNGIKPGSRIYFERNSGAVNILIHGGKLKSLNLGEESEEEVV